MLERHALMEERLTAMIAKRTGKDPRKDPTRRSSRSSPGCSMGTAFNVSFDQRPKDVGTMSTTCSSGSDRWSPHDPSAPSTRPARGGIIPGVQLPATAPWGGIAA